MEKPSSVTALSSEYKEAVARWHTSNTRDLIIESLYAASTLVFPTLVLAHLDPNDADYADSVQTLISVWIIRAIPVVIFNPTELAKTVKKLLTREGNNDYLVAKMRGALNIPAFLRPALVPISVGVSDLTLSALFQNLPQYELIKSFLPLDAVLTLLVTMVMLAQQQSARSIAREILSLSVPATSGVRVATDPEVKDGKRSSAQTQKDPLARKLKRRR